MNITPEKIYETIVSDLSISKLHPLHKAMLEECCETAIESNPNEKNLELLVRAVQIALITCHSTLNATLNATVEATHADQITLNYREQTFVIPKDSGFLKVLPISFEEE